MALLNSEDQNYYFNNATTAPQAPPRSVMPSITPSDQPAADNTPSWRDTAVAAFKQNSMVYSLYGNGQPDINTPQAGYDPYHDSQIKGYEDYLDRIGVDIARRRHPRSSTVSMTRTRAARRWHAAGGYGLTAGLAVGLLDPISLVSMSIPFIPELAGAGRLVRAGVGAAANIAAGEAQQAILTSGQETGHYAEGILPRIGVNALVGGVLGGIARNIPREELDAVTTKTADHMATPVNTSGGQSFGAAGVTAPDYVIAKGGQFINKTLGQTSPMTRVMTSDNVEARRLAAHLTETPIGFEHEAQGVGTPSSIETVAQQARDQRGIVLAHALDEGVLALKGTDNQMTRTEFSAAVANAMRNSDKHEIPEVAKVAAKIRPFFSADRQTLNKLGETEGTEVLGAPSYLPRVYNTQAILHDRAGLEQAALEHFTNNPRVGEDGLPIERYTG